MTSDRLQAFSDGVLAIIITIMVLELQPPEEPTFDSLLTILPVFISYLMSFLYLSIYWNRHHQLFKIASDINGKILWANLNLLFWLSLIPFVTSWIGENHIADIPVILYGLVLLLSEISFLILKINIINFHQKKSIFRKFLVKPKINTLFFSIHIIGLSLMIINDYIPLFFFFIAWVVKVFEIKTTYRDLIRYS